MKTVRVYNLAHLSSSLYHHLKYEMDSSEADGEDEETFIEVMNPRIECGGLQRGRMLICKPWT